MTRARMPVGPPAGNGTTILTGRVGKASGRSCAAAVPIISPARLASPVALRVMRSSRMQLLFGNFHRCAFARQSANAGLPFKILCPYASLVCTRPPEGDDRARSRFVPARSHGDVQLEQAQDRLVRRELLV